MKNDKKEIGFGIIGCGLISTWHAEAILAIPGARLVGATDVNEKSVLDFSHKFGIHPLKSVEELLEQQEIDVVCICTPSGLHAPLAIMAANAGKHIVIEKPMVLNTEEADEVIKACEANNVKMEVISQFRFTQALNRLKCAVDEGLLGRIVSGDIYMKYYRSQEYYDQSGWRGTWKMDGGGALMNQGIHGVDLLLYVMGPVKTVFAHTRTLVRGIEVEDTVAAILEYESGALGVIQAATSVYPGSPRRLEINGERGTIILEEDMIVNWNIQGHKIPKDINLGRSTCGSSSDPSAIGIEGHIRQLSDMVDAIRYNKKPMVDPYEARKPIELIMAIYESSRIGKMVTL